jgi:excinuclease ABC subunit C
MNILKDKYDFSKDNILRVPTKPGVYIFLNVSKIPIYVGKSINLKSRLLSYTVDLVSGKTAKMVSEARFFSILLVNSELEALLLEAKLVKNFYPKYNVQLKDDKHPLYIRITKDKYPMVVTARKIESKESSLAFFGPFPSSKNVKMVLKYLRKIFPYAEHKPGVRSCLYSQIGFCNPCPSMVDNMANGIEKDMLYRKYRQNIRNIKKILEGNIEKMTQALQLKVRRLSKLERFEEAKAVQEQIGRLKYITQPITPISEFLVNPNLIEDIRYKEKLELHKILSIYTKAPNKLTRIECFDVAHLSGTHITASMVTFISGEPEKNLYRHFKVDENVAGDDIAAMYEIAERRERHLTDWGVPDLIVVDGGRAQVGIFWGIFKKYPISVVGLAKRYETLVIPKTFRSKLAFTEVVMPRGNALNLLQRLRDEAHRFARRYHHNLIKKDLIK